MKACQPKAGKEIMSYDMLDQWKYDTVPMEHITANTI